MKKKMVKLICFLIAVLVLAAVLFWGIFPGVYVTVLQHTGMAKGEVNSFNPQAAERRTELDQDIVMTSDLCYGDTYPNSYLDLYQCAEARKGTKVPTFIYLHGGGYAWGDKAEGDPTADTSAPGAATRYLQEICASGWNVVSLNYALAPAFRYPTPLRQMDEAIRYLQQEAGALGLDMSRVVLAGGSAGGQLAGQYCNLVTNPKYAGDLHLPAPALSADAMKGIVLNCALLEPQNFDRTGKVGTDIMFSALKRCYFGASGARQESGDVTAHLTADFPPAFITDGNTGTFNAQAARLDERMSALGIRHEYNYYSRDEAELGHGYDSYLDEPHARDNLDKELKFLKELLEE